MRRSQGIPELDLAGSESRVEGHIKDPSGAAMAHASDRVAKTCVGRGARNITPDKPERMLTGLSPLGRFRRDAIGSSFLRLDSDSPRASQVAVNAKACGLEAVPAVRAALVYLPRERLPAKVSYVTFLKTVYTRTNCVASLWTKHAVTGQNRAEVVYASSLGNAFHSAIMASSHRSKTE